MKIDVQDNTERFEEFRKVHDEVKAATKSGCIEGCIFNKDKPRDTAAATVGWSRAYADNYDATFKGGN